MRQLKTIQNRAAKKNSTPEQRAAVAPVRRAYHAAIRKQQRHHWKTLLEEASDRTVWQASKYATQEQGSATASRIPNLKSASGEATSNQEKAKVLLEMFFPPLPPADLEDTHGYDYPAGLDCPDITELEVRKAIKALSPFKAPGPNAIPNVAL